MTKITWNIIIHLSKYVVSGIIGALIDFSIFTAIVAHYHVYYLVANIISISFALIVVYYLQKNWTFQYVTKERNTFQRYLFCVLIMYLLNIIILYLLVDLLKYNPVSSKIIQILISTIWGYSLTRFIVFSNNRKETNI